MAPSITSSLNCPTNLAILETIHVPQQINEYADEIFRNLFNIERQSMSMSQSDDASSFGGGGGSMSSTAEPGSDMHNNNNSTVPSLTENTVTTSVTGNSDQCSNTNSINGHTQTQQSCDANKNNIQNHCEQQQQQQLQNVNQMPYYRHPDSEVKEKMRAILVDWIVEVHAKFRLMEETLYLTVDLLDRYLQIAPVRRVKLQQVGVTCLFIASKYEEIHPPEIRDLVYITDRSSTRDDILSTEIEILNALGFRLSKPTIFHFLQWFSHLANNDQPQILWPPEQMKSFNLACYTLEMCLLDSRIVTRYAASKLAAAALFMSKKVLRVSPSWPPVLIHRTPYTPQNLKACAKELVPLVTSHGQSMIDPKLKSVKQKYSSEEKMEVSNIYFHM